MAGPWFAVLESGDTWHTLDTVTISNGSKNTLARVEIRLELEKAQSDAHAARKSNRKADSDESERV